MDAGRTRSFRLASITFMFLDWPLWVRRPWHGSGLGLGVPIPYAAGWTSEWSPAAQRRWGPRAVLSLTPVAMAVVLPMAAALGLPSWQRPMVHEVLTTAIPEPLRVSALWMLDVPTLAATIGGR